MFSFGHCNPFYSAIFLFLFFVLVYADDYDPKPDVFDQLINTLVPMVIIALLEINPESHIKSESDANPESDIKPELVIMASKSDNSYWLKCKHVFDDILLLLSIYILLTILFF